MKVEFLHTIDNASEKIIASIENEELRVREMIRQFEKNWQDYKTCEKEDPDEADYLLYGIFDFLEVIIPKLSCSDEEKMKIIDKLYEITNFEYGGITQSGSIVASFKSDQLKEKMYPDVTVCDWEVVESLSTDESKIRVTKPYKDSEPRRYIHALLCLKDEKLAAELLNDELKELNCYEYFTDATASMLTSIMDTKKQVKIGKGNLVVIDKETYIIPYSILIHDNEPSTYDFDCFNDEILPQYLKDICISGYENYREFFTFAKTLGCFSKEEYLEEDQLDQKTTLAQKATSLLAQLLKSHVLAYNYHGYFDSLPPDTKPNPKFLRFLSISEGKNKDKRFINVELLCEMDKKYPGLFASAMANFDSVISLRTTLGENGVPVTIPWEQALEKFYLGREYEGVNSENEDIAKVYSKKGVGQEGFEEAVYLRRTAKKRKVPEHILGKPLKEETILESIERIKDQTKEELKDGKEMIEELYAKKFTFEWLSKYAPENGIMGLFADCCGTITSSYYGSDIARASIAAPDVQNLVIRDHEGNIISKGTMYVNEKAGYAVINDFELNRKYREHERQSGKYDVEVDSKDEQEREQIFQTYLRGIQAFVEEYNNQHPDNRLKQINVGTTYNRLKRQIERYEKATENLTVPQEYNFRDAEYEQYILYQEEQTQEKEIENGEK